jgi:hypothetical protein
MAAVVCRNSWRLVMIASCEMARLEDAVRGGDVRRGKLTNTYTLAGGLKSLKLRYSCKCSYAPLSIFAVQRCRVPSSSM